MKGTFTPTYRVKVPFIPPVFEVAAPSSHPGAGAALSRRRGEGAPRLDPVRCEGALAANLWGEGALHAKRGSGRGGRGLAGRSGRVRRRRALPRLAGNPVWCKEIVSWRSA